MNDLPESIEFVVWDDQRVPYYLPDAESVIRWAQARQLAAASAWRLLHDSARIELRYFHRLGATWEVTGADGIPVAILDADPSDDPAVLEVVNYVAAHMSSIVEPLRVAPVDWPMVAATSESKRARIGFLPPEPSQLGGFTWFYCPELIAGAGGGLTDDEFGYLLSVIDTAVAIHKLHAAMPLAEREALIDSQTATHDWSRRLLERL